MSQTAIRFISFGSVTSFPAWSVIVIVSLDDEAALDDAFAFELEELEDDEQPPNTGTIAAISMAHIIFLNFFISKFPFPIKIYLLYLVFHLYKFAQKKLRVAKI